MNKAEANQFFEENLSIVRIIKKDINKENDLVELNLNNNNEEGKLYCKKKVTKEEVKNSTKKEVKKIKANIKKEERKNIKNSMHLNEDHKTSLR